MCPACITSVALLVIGATSTGGVAMLVMKRVWVKTAANATKELAVGQASSLPAARRTLENLQT